MEYKIYILSHDGHNIYLDNKYCAEFFNNCVYNCYYINCLTLKSNSPIISEDVYTYTYFIKYIEKYFKRFLIDSDDINYEADVKYSFILNEFNKLKMKLREEKLNDLLND